MNIFPFALTEYGTADSLFNKYVKQNRQFLNDTYGTWCYTSKGQERSWSYYEVDAEVTSDTSITFTTYRMANPVHGGRGEMQEQITVVYDTGVLDETIWKHKRNLATQVYADRERRRKQAETQAAIDRVYVELFPESN